MLPLRNIFLFLIIFFTSASIAVADSECTILFLGDSITSGYGISQDRSYPVVVESELRRRGVGDLRIINGGISGSTSAGALSRLKWYGDGPEILVLALGANDGLRGLSLSAMQGNLDRCVEYAAGKGMTVFLAGMEVPPNYGDDYAAGFRNVYRHLARKHNVPLYPFLLQGVAGDPALNLADGIHPNRHGHKIIGRKLAVFIMDNLGSVGPGSCLTK